MKKVITTVGTSLFTNFNSKSDAIKNTYEALEDSPHTDWDEENERIDQIRNNEHFKQWISKNLSSSCAEISSTIKIAEKEQDELEVYLIATDTILSRLACEIIIEQKLNNIQFKFNSNQDVIKDLIVKQGDKFRGGLTNLIIRIGQISEEYYGNVIFNITGGFKGVVPYLTLMAQINQAKLYYLFEDENTLLSIPQIPISLNQEIFETFWTDFKNISDNQTVQKSKLNGKFLNDEQCKNCLEEVEDMVTLNPLGQILWRNYESKFFVYYSTDEVESEISSMVNIQKILAEKFSDAKIRDNKSKMKGSHKVYDDGNNPFRIFYIQRESNIYIYKCFENHDNYERYLNSSQPPENLNNFKPRRLKKQKI